MNRPVRRAGIGLVIRFAVAYCCVARGQHGDGRPNQGNDVIGMSGFWTEICRELGANNNSNIFREWVVVEAPRGNPMGAFAPLLWKFGKTNMDIGPNRQGGFPTTRY